MSSETIIHRDRLPPKRAGFASDAELVARRETLTDARQGPASPAADRREGPVAKATASDRKFDFRIAIIGAGFGGIAAAVYLTKAGFHKFTMFERTDGLGGVWHQNTYPGAEVDTASDWYSFKFKRYDWPKPHSAQPELSAYINETADDYGLRDRIRFNTAVKRAT